MSLVLRVVLLGNSLQHCVCPLFLLVLLFLLITKTCIILSRTPSTRAPRQPIHVSPFTHYIPLMLTVNPLMFTRALQSRRRGTPSSYPLSPSSTANLPPPVTTKHKEAMTNRPASVRTKHIYRVTTKRPLPQQQQKSMEQRSFR